MTTDRKYRFATFNHFEIRIPADIIAGIPQSGPADYAIAQAREDEFVKAELAKLDPKKLAEELAEYGCDWDLTDHEASLDRILWIAVGNIQEEMIDFNIGDEIQYEKKRWKVTDVGRADIEFPNGTLWIQRDGDESIKIDLTKAVKLDD